VIIGYPRYCDSGRVPTYDPPRIGSEIAPQHVNEAAHQAAKHIITTRMASDSKMLPLQDTDSRSLKIGSSADFYSSNILRRRFPGFLRD
jgi:hypothetical protein